MSFLKLINLSFLLSVFMSSLAYSGDFYSECDYCQTSSDFESHAKSVAASSSTARNTILVNNPSTNIVEQYVVVYLRAEPGTPSTLNAYKQTISQETTQKISNLSVARSSLEDAFDTYTDIPEGLAGSAYDLIGRSYLQNDVANYYLNNQSIQQAIGNYTSTALAIAGKIVNIKLVVEVRFANGDVGLFSIEGLDGGANIVLSLFSATDQNGNNISLVKAGYTSGSYRFTNDSLNALQDFLDAAGRLGIPIDSSGDWSSDRTVPLPGGGSFTCEHRNGQYECTATGATPHP